MLTDLREEIALLRVRRQTADQPALRSIRAKLVSTNPAWGGLPLEL
jgi:hypothetical protein